MLKNGERQIRIVHRELVASVTGSVAFAVNSSISLNPGLVASFPWLSSQAQGWERYRFNRLKFCYFTRTGTATPGSVIMSPDYDAADSAPVSEQVASTYEDTKEDAPWKDIDCTLTPQSLHALGPTKFIRTGPLNANQDIKTYDAGTFYLSTVDGTAVSWGKLWVEYDVTLFNPQLNAGGGGSLAYQRITGVTPTNTSLLGTQTQVPSSTETIVSVSGEVVTFNKAGTFLVNLSQLCASGGTFNALPVIAAGGASVGQGIVQTGSGTSLFNTVQLTAVVGTTITYDQSMTGGTTAQLVVAQLPAASA